MNAPTPEKDICTTPPTALSTIDPQPAFTAREMARLSALRRQNREDRDLFSPRELAYLRFMRWLVARTPRATEVGCAIDELLSSGGMS